MILLFTCMGFVLLGTACQNDDIYEEYEPEPPVIEEPKEVEDFEFSINLIYEAEIGNYPAVNYGDYGGLNLLFNFNQPVTNFSIINVVLTNFGTDDELNFAKTGEAIHVGHVEDILVLTNYWTLGTFPHLGFTFTNPNGEDVWYTFQQSMMDGAIHWQLFDWSHEYELYELDVDTVVVYHTVVAGETMFSISRMYGTNVATILELNDLENYDVSVGQVLRMPDGSEKDSTLATHNRPHELEIIIDWLNAPVANYVNFDYAAARDSSIRNENQLLIAPDRLLREFGIVQVNPDSGDGTPVATDMMFFVGDLIPTRPLIIDNYFGQGTFSHSGFTFIDETDTRRFFWFIQNQADGGPSFIMVEFDQDDFSFWDQG